MSITIHLHPDLIHYADGCESVETDGNTVDECLRKLVTRYPKLRKLVFYKDRTLQTFMEIYLNRKAVYSDELASTVKKGDEIHLIMMIAGG